MDDGASLDELKRRAYSSDDSDALEARQLLAALDHALHPDAAAGTALPLELPRLAAFPTVFAAALVVLMTAAATVASVVALTPRSSLEVFSRPQTTQDLEIPDIDLDVRDGSQRWIGSSGGFEIFAYLTGDDDVCLVVVILNGVSGACAPPDVFRDTGIDMRTGQFTSTGTEYFSVHWGPYGGPHYDSYSE